MIGLKLPRLFYGRKKRERVIGVRAGFCEFCVSITRHWIVVFESAQTVFFIPSTYEEYSRESKCEICRTQFAANPSTKFLEPRQGAELTIGQLVEKTSPGLLAKADAESRQMVERAQEAGCQNGESLLAHNQLVNFLRCHESDFKLRTRHFFPLVAVGSIQAVIGGLAMTWFAPLALALGFALAMFLLAVVFSLMVLRKRTLNTFAGSVDKLIALTHMSCDQIEQNLAKMAHRFPKSTALLQYQVHRRSVDPEISFESGRDFVSLLDAQVPDPEQSPDE